MRIENGKVYGHKQQVQFSVTDDVEGRKVDLNIVVSFDGVEVSELAKVALAGNSKRVALVNSIMRPNGATWMESIPAGYEVPYQKLCFKDSWPEETPEMAAEKAERQVTAKVNKMSVDEQLALFEKLQERLYSA